MTLIKKITKHARFETGYQSCFRGTGFFFLFSFFLGGGGGGGGDITKIVMLPIGLVQCNPHG